MPRSSIAKIIASRRSRDDGHHLFDAYNSERYSPSGSLACVHLQGHTMVVNAVLAIPDINVLITACDDGHLRIYAQGGNGVPIHDIAVHPFGISAIAYLGNGIVVSGSGSLRGQFTSFSSHSGDCIVTTWRVPSGEHLESLPMEGSDLNSVVGAITNVKEGCFAVAGWNDVFFVFHANGKNLGVLNSATVSDTGVLCGISSHGDVIVSSGLSCPGEKTGKRNMVKMYSATTYKELATFRSHKLAVTCIHVNSNYIATGSCDKTVRVHENRRGYALVCALETHGEWITQVCLANEGLLLSASKNRRGGTCIIFTSLPTGEHLARMDIGIEILCSIAVAENGHLACVGVGLQSAILVSPPAIVANALTSKHCLPYWQLAEPAPVTCKLLQYAVHGEPARNRILLEELREASTKAGTFESMTIDYLSSCVGGAMVNYQCDLSPHLDALIPSLGKVFRSNGIAGDSIANFPSKELLKVVIESLRKESKYISLGENVMRQCEWRLQRFLHNLRSGNGAGTS